MRQHLKTHRREKLNKSNLCDFASYYAKSLKTHLKRHTGEKMHKCTHCNYSSLRLLENAFENKQPNKCNQCSYASSPAGHLKTHLQTHSSEKPNSVIGTRSIANSKNKNLSIQIHGLHFIWGEKEALLYA